MTKKTPRFDLFAVLEWTAAIAFICALVAGAGGSSVWTCTFATLPADDSTLRTWLDSQNSKDVIISREGNSVTLSSRTGLLSGFRSAFNVPKPPWQHLGYGMLRTMSGSMRWTIFSGSPYLWISGFGILIVLGMIRRRFIAPKQKPKKDAVEAPRF